MTIWPPRRDDLKRPAYRSIASYLSSAIEAGEIAPGTRLPPHRTLAYELGVSVQTVSRAYEELRRLGILSGEVGRGTFVRAGHSDAKMPWQRPTGSDNVIDLSMLAPVTGQIHVECMSRVLSELARDPPRTSLFSFRPRATLEQHCGIARRWLMRCGLETGQERILPTNGCTAAMSVALRTAVMPGELIVTEEISHHTLDSLASTLGFRLAGLPFDDQGILPDAFERACREMDAKVLFSMPNGLGPTASLMSEARRQALVSIARAQDVLIVESDALGPIEPERPPPLAALAPERSFYFTGMTKCILPGLRIAWLVVPEQFIASARTCHLVTHWMATPLIAEIASRWIEEGTAAELLQWQQANLAARIRLARATLGDIPHRAMPHGLHVWLPLPAPWREDAIVAHAWHEGVAIAAGRNFTVGDSALPQAVRICIGAGSEADVAKGVGVIARLARSTPQPAHLAI